MRPISYKIKLLNRTLLTTLTITTLLFSIGAQAQEKQDEGTASTRVENQQTMASTMAYWTAEKMQNAVAATVPPSFLKKNQLSKLAPSSTPVAVGIPTLVPGWNPNSGEAQPAVDAKSELSQEQAKTSDFDLKTYGSPPSNPVDYANYGKFQRFTMFGNYLKYPRSILGKLFFSSSTGNFVCSATVVNRSMVITAGHCVANGGASTFYSNFVFCPSYYKGSGSGAAHPAVGCWPYVYAATSSDWYANGSIDRDYACISLATTGTIVANKIGNVTGWAGMAYNFGADEMVLSTGYPAGSPFAGYHIIATMAAEWYTVNQFSADVHLSKYIGNDMTGGSSGGGWLINWEHSSARYAERDSTSITDPLGSSSTPYVHGVNSHSRCLGSCGTATSTSGTFFNEMGSPVFVSSGSDAGDVQSVYSLCVSNGGT